MNVLYFQINGTVKIVIPFSGLSPLLNILNVNGTHMSEAHVSYRHGHTGKNRQPPKIAKTLKLSSLV